MSGVAYASKPARRPFRRSTADLAYDLRASKSVCVLSEKRTYPVCLASQWWLALAETVPPVGQATPNCWILDIESQGFVSISTV